MRVVEEYVVRITRDTCTLVPLVAGEPARDIRFHSDMVRVMERGVVVGGHLVDVEALYAMSSGTTVSPKGLTRDQCRAIMVAVRSATDRLDGSIVASVPQTMVDLFRRHFVAALVAFKRYALVSRGDRLRLEPSDTVEALEPPGQLELPASVHVYKMGQSGDRLVRMRYDGGRVVDNVFHGDGTFSAATAADSYGVDHIELETYTRLQLVSLFGDNVPLCVMRFNGAGGIADRRRYLAGLVPVRDPSAEEASARRKAVTASEKDVRDANRDAGDEERMKAAAAAVDAAAAKKHVRDANREASEERMKVAAAAVDAAAAKKGEHDAKLRSLIDKARALANVPRREAGEADASATSSKKDVRDANREASEERMKAAAAAVDAAAAKKGVHDAKLRSLIDRARALANGTAQPGTSDSETQ